MSAAEQTGYERAIAQAYARREVEVARVGLDFWTRFEADTRDDRYAVRVGAWDGYLSALEMYLDALAALGDAS